MSYPADQHGPHDHRPISPTKRDAELAAAALSRLAHLKDQVEITIKGTDDDEPVLLPKSAVKLLVEVLTEMSRVNAVAVVPVRPELSTQQAAELLGVSRPFLIKALDERKLPYRMVGTHRRIRLHDLLAYRDEMDRSRHDILDELTKQAQDLSMGY